MNELFILVELGIIWLLRRIFSQNLVLWLATITHSKNIAVWLYSILTLPGVVVHEMAHFLFAALLGLRTGSIELLPLLDKFGNVEFGSVQVEKADPIRLSLVGIAPLVAGLPLIAWMSLQMTQQSPWAWGYLLTCIALHMLPSKKDLAYWPAMVMVLAAYWWLGAYTITSDYLIESIIHGLQIPIGLLLLGITILGGINFFFGRRKIVQ